MGNHRHRPLWRIGVKLTIPQQFLDHASRAQVLEQVGLTAQQVSRDVVEHFSRQAVVALEDLPRP